jgi:hypothetical protein
VNDQPPRVRVTGPPRRRTGAVRQSGAGEIDAGTALGAIYMRSLLREQLRLAAGILLVLAVSVGGLPLLFHLAPGLAGVRLAGVPLAWLLLGLVVYPWLVVLGWAYVRRAEANERDFAELVERREPPP